MNLTKFWSGDKISQSNASIFPVFHKEKVLGAVRTDFVLIHISTFGAFSMKLRPGAVANGQPI